MKKIKTLAYALLSISILVLGGVLAYFASKANTALDRVYYTITFDSEGGSDISPIKVEAGKLIPKPADPLKTGYYLEKWNYKDSEWNFSTDIVDQNITLNAEWGLTTYTISYNFAGGTTEEEYSTTYTIESDFDLVRPIKDDVIFIGWFNDSGNRIDSIIPGMYGDLVVNAKWVGGFFPISEDESKGSINVYASETEPNTFIVSNNPVNNKHHLFKGWYDKNGVLLSKNSTYTITIDPNVNYYIYSKYMSESEEAEWNDSHGVNPVLHSNDSTPYITYGMYPQSNVNDSDLIDKLNQLDVTRFNNYYYYNHEYYTKLIAKLAKTFDTHELLAVRQFDNGDEFEEDETYWFKVEPLSWKILKESNNQYTLLSERLLDVQRYHNNSATRTIDDKTVYANNYKYSDIREWLNNGFKFSAFAFNTSPLTIMEVDNSKESTATPDSGFECENTFDHVTLLSFKEYNDYDIANRRIKTTDYVRVSDAYYSVDESNLFSGYYWTRSPIETEKDNGTSVSRCNMNGTLNNDFVGWGGSCVQPAIKITL